MNVTLRTATSSDQAWQFQLHEDAHRALVEAAYGPWDEEQQLQFFLALVHAHNSYIIECDGGAVGAVYLGLRNQDQWLELIEVSSDRQNQGIGSTALDWILSKAENDGRGTLLQVHQLNTGALRLYEQKGFLPAGQTESHELLRHPRAGDGSTKPRQ